jgi:pSer/pThr/pTyr-binding forkhead associated (FHA) protein
MLTPLESFLDEAASHADGASFASVYPHPALTIRLPNPDVTDSQVQAMNLSETCDDEGLDGLLGDPLLRTHVCFLTKSARNPFQNIISLGRVETNDVCVPHPSVSKVHATFMRVGDDWKVSERSRNGLWVDRVPVAQGHTPNVKNGTLLSFGTQVEGTFHTPEGLYAYLALIRARKATR